jgi:hypothetical protein
VHEVLQELSLIPFAVLPVQAALSRLLVILEATAIFRAVRVIEHAFSQLESFYKVSFIAAAILPGLFSFSVEFVVFEGADVFRAIWPCLHRFFTIFQVVLEVAFIDTEFGFFLVL